MKELIEEMEKAKEILNESIREYTKKPTKYNFDWYINCRRYYEGLKKAFDLIERDK